MSYSKYNDAHYVIAIIYNVSLKTSTWDDLRQRHGKSRSQYIQWERYFNGRKTLHWNEKNKSAYDLKIEWRNSEGRRFGNNEGIDREMLRDLFQMEEWHTSATDTNTRHEYIDSLFTGLHNTHGIPKIFLSFF